MRFCYQVATPDVAIADSVTAYQGPLEKSFSELAALGYKGVELMTLNPSKLDWDFHSDGSDLFSILLSSKQFNIRNQPYFLEILILPTVPPVISY